MSSVVITLNSGDRVTAKHEMLEWSCLLLSALTGGDLQSPLSLTGSRLEAAPTVNIAHPENPITPEASAKVIYLSTMCNEAYPQLVLS
ncbi:hypothetical protein J6590_037403 [Homalodisca vitripennis]|nr:hypothetical protein J6590_037403 [Homalodisca vitripennis]